MAGSQGVEVSRREGLTAHQGKAMYWRKDKLPSALWLSFSGGADDVMPAIRSRESARPGCGWPAGRGHPADAPSSSEPRSARMRRMRGVGRRLLYASISGCSSR